MSGITDLLVTQCYHIFDYVIARIGYLFYLVDPRKCMFDNISSVPRYVEEMFPVFVVLAIAENGLRLLKGKTLLRANDTIASIGQGIFQECVRLKLRSFEVLVYCVVWNNYRIFTLSWDSLITWWLCFLGVDLGFYVFHRASHEINVMWSVHQAHHSAEDFTMLSSLRQAALQPFTAWFAYLPLALFIPPPIFLTHLQLSELYMIWIHTEVVQSLGPLEWVLNTPAHHRVHHGRNRQYIDKNYGGTLIIWDRLFGTFQAEQTGEPVVYGLVHPVQSYNPFYLQFHHMICIFDKVINADNWRDGVNYLWKGPGWAPGKARLGHTEDVPLLKHPVTYWSPSVPIWLKVYTIFHFGLVLLFYNGLIANHKGFSQTSVSSCIALLLLSITTTGLLLENKRLGLYLELFRCLLIISIHSHFLPIQLMLTPMPMISKLIDRLVSNIFITSSIICVSLIAYELLPNIDNYLKRFDRIVSKVRKQRSKVNVCPSK